MSFILFPPCHPDCRLGILLPATKYAADGSAAQREEQSPKLPTLKASDNLESLEAPIAL